jgi:hypothetical protein
VTQDVCDLPPAGAGGRGKGLAFLLVVPRSGAPMDEATLARPPQLAAGGRSPQRGIHSSCPALMSPLVSVLAVMIS